MAGLVGARQRWLPLELEVGRQSCRALQARGVAKAQLVHGGHVFLVEQVEEVKAEANKARTRGPRKPVVDTDQVETEDILLGESTLAKLNVTRKVEETPAVNDEPAAGEAA